MGCKAAETTCNINNTFSPGTANKCTVQWWFKKICKGDESLEDEEQSGWPSEVDNDHLRAIIKVDPLQFNSVQFSHSVVSDSLQPIFNSNKKIIRICFLSNNISIVKINIKETANNKSLEKRHKVRNAH